MSRLSRHLAPASGAGADLESLAREAWSAGGEVDLQGCLYGPSFRRTPRYYRFLAGLARIRRMRRVLELGTHCGGSIAAIARAIAPAPDARLVTVDRHTRPQVEAPADVELERVIGDILESSTAAMTTRDLREMDLLLVDFQSRPYCVLRALELYAVPAAPALVAIDDIRLNPPMRRLWARLSAIFGRYCRDVSSEARRDDPEVANFPIGMGLIAWRAATSARPAHVHGRQDS